MAEEKKVDADANLRRAITNDAPGKVIRAMVWWPEPESDYPTGGYWTIEFQDGSEIAVQLMCDLTRTQRPEWQP